MGKHTYSHSSEMLVKVFECLRKDDWLKINGNYVDGFKIKGEVISLIWDKRCEEDKHEFDGFTIYWYLKEGGDGIENN